MIKTSHAVRIVNRPNTTAEALKSGLYLEIQKGRTQFPYRPVRTGRFLIGNGAGCDLRLGGDDVPPLHSIVHHEDGQFRLESVAAAPPMRVNREPVDSAVLADGDHVSIGTIEFIARFAVPEHRSAAVSRRENCDEPEVVDVAAEEELDETNLADLTAEQLIDLIDSEQAEVDEFESRRQLGGQALLHSAISRSGHSMPGDQVATLSDELAGSEMEIIRRLERAVERLSRFTSTTERAPEQTLAERLQSLADRVSETTPSRGPRSAA